MTTKKYLPLFFSCYAVEYITEPQRGSTNINDLKKHFFLLSSDQNIGRNFGKVEEKKIHSFGA